MEQKVYEERRKLTLALMKNLNEYVEHGGTFSVLMPPDKKGLFIKPMYDTTSKPMNAVNKKKKYLINVK